MPEERTGVLSMVKNISSVLNNMACSFEPVRFRCGLLIDMYVYVHICYIYVYVDVGDSRSNSFSYC